MARKKPPALTGGSFVSLSLGSAVGLRQPLNGLAAISHSLGIVPKRHGRVAVARQLGDQSHLDALGLQGADEAVSGAMRSHIGQVGLHALEKGQPDALPEIGIQQHTAAMFLLRPLSFCSETGENEPMLAVLARALQFPFEQPLAQEAPKRNFPHPGLGFGEVGYAAVFLQHPVDADDAFVKVHIRPVQGQHLGRADAGEEREGDIKALPAVFPRLRSSSFTCSGSKMAFFSFARPRPSLRGMAGGRML